MSLKDLFSNNSGQVVINKSLEDLNREAQTENYLDSLIENNERYLPNVDFSDPVNFARYGSAEKYYVDGIKNIYQHYPYDGSKKEKLDWRNRASQIDLYILDNIYPKSVGYVNLSSSVSLSTVSGLRSSSLPQYVSIKGGPNVSSTGQFSLSNIYDPANNRESNLSINGFGNTVEFWFKDEVSSSNTNYNSSYALFDLWNSITASSADYSRLTIAKISGSNKFAVTYRSGSSGITNETIDYTFDSSAWHHYAFSFSPFNTSDLLVSLYIDGVLVKSEQYSSSAISSANNNNAIAYIGALRASIVSADSSHQGLGASYGSYDEFRFWKKCRNPQEIYRNWFLSVDGGSNTDDSNIDLGVYLKFNEGIVNTASVSEIDKICIDYSGRISNGALVNYSVGTKITSSAVDEYFGETKEEKDIIIFSSNPLVQQAIQTYGNIGFAYDQTNISSIYKSLPSWITEENEKQELEDLPSLIQIISSYFDTLHIQIENVNKIKNLEYTQDSEKPKPFAKQLLTSHGFDNLELFTDTTFLEKVLSRNENAQFEKNLSDIKNTIYQNIYNNLAYIYKSKGTEKSLRNLIRCFGVDDELIKINLYSDNTKYDISDKFIYSSVPKKFVDFNNPDRYDGYVYQKRKSTDLTNTKSYIPSTDSGSIVYIPITVQAEVIFPKQLPIESTGYFTVDFITSSLFGAHTANQNDSIYTWGNDEFNFQVYSIREKVGSPNTYFLATGSFSGSGFALSSSIYKDVYDNQKWNFALKIKPNKYDQVNIANGSQITDYSVEFVGYNSLADSVDNVFNISTNISQSNMVSALTKHKRLYVGSHYQDFDNTQLLCKTDVKISSLRFWYDYLTDEEIKLHSFESTNFGRNNPNWNPDYFLSISSDRVFTKSDTLALNWDFSNVSSSDSNGQFIVEDLTSGSLQEASSNEFGWFSGLVGYQYPGFADEFLENDDQVVNKEYVLSAKKQNPEIINGNDLIQTPDTDDVTRIKDSKAITYYLSIEKSMAQVVNDEIMNWFATIKGYNNLIGEPVERYKAEYSGLRQMREIFFKNIGSTLNFEKFFEFYKWIDSSLSNIIEQLIPLSTNASTKVRNMVESHMLERSKYENKTPTIEFKGEPRSYPIVSHLQYNYKEQAAYPNNLNSEVLISRYYTDKPLWLKQRIQRTDVIVSSSLEPQNDIDREIIRQVINQNNIDKLPTLFSSDTAYEGRNDVSRVFTKTYRIIGDTLYNLEDTLTFGNISNNRINSQFLFASASVTASGQVVQPLVKKGNYLNTYEFVQMSSRTNNNKSFIDLTGSIFAVSGTNILGFTDRTLPVRAAYKNIFVERFSAPGGPEVLSRGTLDKNAEEYSAYNSLNYRNFRVRKNLNKWLAETSSIDSENPSLHKNADNIARYPGDDNNSYTNTQNDNAFISHAIPRSDYQYSWITSSMQSNNLFSGYSSKYTNLDIQYTFVSGNVSGSSIVDFVGLNTTIPKTINTSSNTLSSVNAVIDVNKYLSNINGPYQHPTWKQIRGGESLLSRVSRKNNKILVQDTPILKTKIVNNVVVPYIERTSQTFTSYKEMPVSYNKPMTHVIDISGSDSLIETISTYDNNKERFSNELLGNTLGIDAKETPEYHDILSNLEKGLFEPKPEIVEIKYENMAYPNNTYVGSADVRLRDNYEDFIDNTGSIVNARTFWRDSIDERARASVTEDIYENLNTSYEQINNDYLFYPYNNENSNETILINQNNCFRESILSLDSYMTSSYSSQNIGIYIPSNPIADGTYNNIAFTNDGYSWTNMNLSMSNDVKAIVSNVYNNDIYIGGSFTSVNGNSVRAIIKWNNGLTSSVGTIISGEINTLVSGNNGIYAGGTFVTSTGQSRIARWDGTAWNNVGSGLSNTVLTLFSASSGLYAGGIWTTNTGSRIAKFDGIAWSAIGGGISDQVYSIFSNSSGLYAGTRTTARNGYLTKYNTSTLTWNSLGSVGTVYSITQGPTTTNLYLGIDSTSYYGFVSYNGAVFSGVPFSGTGLSPDSEGAIICYSMYSSSDGIILGGRFAGAGSYGGSPYYESSRIIKWNYNIGGTSGWQRFGSGISKPVSGGFRGYVNTIFSNSSGLYIGGNFTSRGPYVYPKHILNYNNVIHGDIKNSNILENIYNIKNNISYKTSKIAIYDVKQENIYNISKSVYYNSELDFGGTVPGFEIQQFPILFSIITASDGIYVGGTFNSIGASSIANIAKWNGNTFENFANLYYQSLIYGYGINKIISGSDGIYFCGQVKTSLGGQDLYVLKWANSLLTTLSSSVIAGTDKQVYDILSGNTLFTTTANSVNYYNVGAFSALPAMASITYSNYSNNSIASASNGLIVAGNFTITSSAYSILRTDINNWYSFPKNPLNVTSVCSGADGIYIASRTGVIVDSDLNNYNYIAKITDSGVVALGKGLNGSVRSMTSNSSGLYVGGTFTSGANSDNTSILLNNIAKWDGVNWTQVGEKNNNNGFNINVNDTVAGLSSDEKNVYIAGNFLTTRSSPKIKDKNYSNYFYGYYNQNNLIIPTPQLIFNNNINNLSCSSNKIDLLELTYDSLNNSKIITKYSGSHNVKIINNGYEYEINEKSNKTPFFNSYLEYLGDLKTKTQKYSVIPEYTISDFVKTYIKEKNGNYNAIINNDYLKLDGAAQEQGYEDINNSINISNLIKPELIFNNSKNNENINLNFKISSIKKLIPYRDFYPSERIIKLSNYFINSFLDIDTRLTSVLNSEEVYSSSLSNGTPINQQILTLLQPMMAPGILLNTIKSSIAVDWPIFIANSGSYNLTGGIQFYSHTGSNLITNTVYDSVSDRSYAYTASNYIDKEQNYRLPFEAIIEFDTRIPQELRSDDKNMYYLNPSYYTSDVLTGSDYSLLSYPSYNMGSGSLKAFIFRDANYKLAMHNFLAEIPNFFLNGKLTNIISLPENEFTTAKRGVTYYMDVVLERDSKYKEFIADPYYEGLKAQANSFYDGTFLLPSPDSLYGPPTRYWNNVNPNPFFSRSPYNFYSKLLDTPAYAPYVPPYYYGKAVARISFTADDTRQYSLSEIQSSCSVEYINTEAEALFNQRSNFINGNFTGSFIDNYSTSPAYKQMMRLSSSVNLFLAIDTKLTKFDPKTGQTTEVGDREGNNKSWVIQTKFETPSINFINADLSNNLGLKFLGGTKESGSVKGIYSYMMKGLWTTYGEPVDNGSGIKLYIQDSFQKRLTNQTGSLIELCGFRNAGDKKTIGLLSERKKVSECIVMIPYTFNKNHGPNMNTDYATTIDPILGENGIYLSSQTGNGPYYYAIDINVITDYLGGLKFKNASVEQIKTAAESSPYQESTIIKLILAMTKYVIPPHLDWIRNKNINPFVMYLAEFSTEFDKRDLSDIWQGVMPKQSYKAEIEQIDINHKFTNNEFFHGKRPQNDTKFKVFKVKQRANINYYKLTDDSKDDDRFKFTFSNSQQATIPEYSYNWPYDFFSLVELVNIETSLEYKKPEEKEIMINPNEILSTLQDQNPISQKDKIEKLNKKAIPPRKKLKR